MKKLFAFASPLILIFFTGCGGDTSTPPPPPPPLALQSTVTTDVLKELQNKAEQMKKDCAGTPGNPSPITQYIGVSAAAIYLPPGTSAPQLPPPQVNNCTNSLLNFTTDFFTAGNGQYNQFAMPWYTNQIRGAASRGVAILQGMGVNLNYNNVQQIGPAISGVWQQINQRLNTSGLPSNVICQLNQSANQGLGFIVGQGGNQSVCTM